MFETIRAKKAPRAIIFAVLFILAAIFALLLYNTTSPINQSRLNSPERFEITSKAALIHVGSNDSFAITQDGIQAGQMVLDFLETKKPNYAQTAIQVYKRLIPVENYGGEYSTLQWFCEYLLAADNQKKQILSNKFDASFYEFFAENDFARLKEYLKRKYKLENFPDQDTEAGKNRLAVLEDTILFTNPKREEWEKTSKIISVLNLKPGQAIADVGSGPGYYTFKFSELVGNKGNVFAIDTVQEHLNYINNVNQKYGIRNIKTINTTGDTIGVSENQADVVFLCSLYHNIYAMSRESERESFVNSINKALKKNGKLLVVDNALVKESELPYHGPYIAKELIIGQFKYYGFRLVAEHAYIPQRYILEFKKA